MASNPSIQRVDAQNFLKVLNLIDRTILPRRLFLFNGTNHVVLLASRRRAYLEEAQPASLAAVTDAIARLCCAGQPVDYRLEPIARAPSVVRGFAAIEIVNAQDRPGRGQEAEEPRQYRFAPDGWPLSAPDDASLGSLMAAARIAWAISGWQELHGEELQPPTLILAISDAVPHDMAVSVDGNLTIASTPPASLGRLVSRWQHRSADGKPKA